jgi:hypothetical protein
MSYEQVEHYRKSNIQPIDVIVDWNLGFCLGNAIKYLGRAGKKKSASEQDDLQKALWYLVFEITKKAGVADNIVTAISDINSVTTPSQSHDE